MNKDVLLIDEKLHLFYLPWKSLHPQLLPSALLKRKQVLTNICPSSLYEIMSIENAILYDDGENRDRGVPALLAAFCVPGTQHRTGFNIHSCRVFYRHSGCRGRVLPKVFAILGTENGNAVGIQCCPDTGICYIDFPMADKKTRRDELIPFAADLAG